MPNILKVTKEEITWQLSGSNINAGAQANARIKEYLGEDARFFASMSATTTGYTWTSRESGWIPLTSATNLQRDKVKSVLEALRNRIRERLSSKPRLAGEILSLPSDDGKYIFFIEDNDGMRILIAGWGFSNARRKVIIPGRNKKEIISIPIVKIGFTINGALQPSHKFYITTLGGASKECFTDTEGFYHLGEQKAGTNVNLIDADSGKSISFTVEEEQSEYIFDITRDSKVCIKVTCDDAPLDNTEVSIGYHGSINTYTTNSFGEVNISLPFFNNEILNISVNGVDKSTVCQYPETDIEIQLTKPKEKKDVVIIPEPPVNDTKLVSVRCINQNGDPLYDYPITIVIRENTSDFLTDKEGIVKLSPQTLGTNIKVIDGFDNSKSMTHIVDESDNIIEFIIPEEVPSIPDNILQMIGIDGNPMANRKVVLRQGDKALILSLDGDGTTRFKINEFECGKDMSAQILSKENEHDQIPFTLDENEHDYVIQEIVATKNPWWHKFLNIVMAIILITAITELGAIFVQHLPFV